MKRLRISDPGLFVLTILRAMLAVAVIRAFIGVLCGSAYRCPIAEVN